jgi:hypothetical protein
MLRPCFIALLVLASCHRQPTAPLPQRAYVWQRQWTPAVADAARQAAGKLDGLVIFGAEVSWEGKNPKVLQTTIDWSSLRNIGKPVGLALRIAPYPGPYDDVAITGKLAATASSLMERARQEQVVVNEFQVDFDCAQKKLNGYALWLPDLRSAVKPVPLVITTLPSWLDEPEFPKLLDQTDGYVLQVHSIMPQKATPQTLICDPDRARAWVQKASRLKRPFTVALSTYSGLAGYDGNGRFVGLALDGVQPSWPAGTRIMQFRSDAADIAALVREWQDHRRPHLREIIWYRLPVATDQRNWRWRTFAAVVEGRPPVQRLTVLAEGDNPRDLALLNDGESEEDLADVTVVGAWSGPGPVAVEALPGWTVSQQPGRAVFRLRNSLVEPLPPGGRRGIGWVRFDQPTPLHVQIVR